MLTVTTILGNIKNNPDLNQKYKESLNKNSLETITIQRSETEKVRMRKVSDKKTDVGFILPSRTHLRDGDVAFLDDTKMIIIKLSPELVAVLNIKKNIHHHRDDGDGSKSDHNHDHHDHNHDHHDHNHEFTNVAIKVGHTIGNLHRPLKISGSDIIFPIQTPDEINLFLRLLSGLKDYVDIRAETLIFEPDQGFDIHAH
ncbi:urease accessory protein UreE [Candidatus Nitrosocosmicus sp. FF01]|uniref:urease accessory protein UreE n=1 Tax=Candidatus Nitrosocosmicus sp. FF01 TaxID=3397670 RepID=UPI0039EC8F08